MAQHPCFQVVLPAHRKQVDTPNTVGARFVRVSCKKLARQGCFAILAQLIQPVVSSHRAVVVIVLLIMIIVMAMMMLGCDAG